MGFVWLNFVYFLCFCSTSRRLLLLKRYWVFCFVIGIGFLCFVCSSVFYLQLVFSGLCLGVFLCYL